MFKNPLDTDVDRPGWEIGEEETDTKLLYAGPKYGMKTREEYNKLLESGALGRGQQAVELTGQQIVDHGKDIYNKVSEVIPDFDLPEMSPEVKNAINTAGQLAGKVWEISGLQRQVNQTMNILDAPVKGIAFASKLQYEDGGLNFGGRGIGEAPLRVIETALPFVGGAKNIAKKGIQKVVQYSDEVADAIKISRQLQPAYATVGVTDDITRGAIKTVDTATDFKPNTVFASTTVGKNTVSGFKRPPRTPEVKQLIKESEEFRPEGFRKQTWGNYIEKFGDKDSALAAIDKSKESAAYLREHGSLTGNKNTWKAPNGQIYYVNNKTSRLQKLKGEVSIGFDNLKSIEKTLEARSAGAKLNEKLIYELAETIPGWDKAKAARYIEESKQAKRTLEHLIKDLNKGEGRTMWSLGHRTAVKHLPHSADRALNIELEPLIDVLTTEGRKIAGNTGRAANDELGELLSKITNNPTDLRADMLHWGDDVIGKFMPRMREITDAKTFFEEIVKREDFIAKIKAYAKKNKVTLEEAGDVVMKPLMDKTPTSKAPYFE